MYLSFVFCRGEMPHRATNSCVGTSYMCDFCRDLTFVDDHIAIKLSFWSTRDCSCACLIRGLEVGLVAKPSSAKCVQLILKP